MAIMYYDKDANLERLNGKTIGIIGYGSQGHAHALNLRDSGQKVMIGLYPGSPSWVKAEQQGLSVASVAETAQKSDILMMLAPDTAQPRIYQDSIAPYLTPGKTLMFAHGFNIHYHQIVAPSGVDVTMVAPKAPGHRLRAVFTQNSGVPALVAVHQDATGEAKPTALAYAKGLGSTRAGVLDTTFQEETETDLFGEQTVLCGGVSNLIKAAFEVLTEAGYQPESAYFEVLHELKLIVDLIYEGGLEYMRYSVSDTAEYGDYSRGPRVIDSRVKESMRSILREIQDGTFAKEWIAENDEGRKRFVQLRNDETAHPVELIGKELRPMMNFLQNP